MKQPVAMQARPAKVINETCNLQAIRAYTIVSKHHVLISEDLPEIPGLSIRSNIVQDQEAEWLAQAQKGDQLAFTNLVETYQRPVYNLCYRMLSNAEDAEDAAQETFLRAYRSMKRYDRNRPFSTWILSIAAHYCIDQIRRRRMTIVSIEDLPVPELPDRQPGPEFTVGQRQELSRIRSLLDVLDGTDRSAVILYYWYDFSYQEISEALSLTVSAVKSRLHRARRSMAQQWLENQKKPQSLMAERVQHESSIF